MASASPVVADTLYATDFEDPPPPATSPIFLVGDDRIVGTDNWVGTLSTTAPRRSGIASETGTAAHGVPGLGKAGWIGGNTERVTLNGTNINVRRPVLVPAAAYDPVASNKEIITISCLLGIKDSTGTTSFLNRDDFEVFIVNSGNAVLAALQFDNTTMNTQSIPPVPQRLVLRSISMAGNANINYTSTGGYFLYDVIQTLAIRINWRTNRWSAFLDDALLFNDQPFYLGTSARNLGAVGFRMNFGSANLIIAPQYSCVGGSNYMLFDEFTIQADPLTKAAIELPSRLANGHTKLTWSTEAGYTYRLYRSTSLANPWTLLSTSTATSSTSFSFTDAGSTSLSRAFYRVNYSFP
jgi:hypothetical protein